MAQLRSAQAKVAKPQQFNATNVASVKLNADIRWSVFAAWSGWAIDAFDFFILIKTLPDIIPAFHITKVNAAFLITATLFMRPVGALFFGLLGDKFGRKIPFLSVILSITVISFSSAFAPNYQVFFTLRLLFGIAMGGEWGLGAALAMEKVPDSRKGLISGILQSGYPAGYLLAVCSYLLIHTSCGMSWRYIYVFSLIPSLASLYIFFKFEESEEWEKIQEQKRHNHTHKIGGMKIFFSKPILLRFLLLTLAIFAFLSLSHSTQDLYPLFLVSSDHQGAHLSESWGNYIALAYTFSALIGSVLGGRLSDKYGKKKIVIVAVLLTLCDIPLFAFGNNGISLGIGAVLMQFLIQAAWSIVPMLLSDLSPPQIRGVFSGVIYQLGAVLTSFELPIQSEIANNHGYPVSLAVMINCAVVLIIISIVTIRQDFHTDELI